MEHGIHSVSILQFDGSLLSGRKLPGQFEIVCHTRTNIEDSRPRLALSAAGL